MSNNEEEFRGPTMIVATKMLKKPARKFAFEKLNVLPKALTLKELIFVGGGVVFGICFALVSGVGFAAVPVGSLIGGSVGYYSLKIRPYSGETFFKWVGLKSKSTLDSYRSKAKFQGREVKLYIGVGQIPYSSLGRVRIYPGHVDVAEGSVDERGVILSDKEMGALKTRKMKKAAEEYGVDVGRSQAFNRLPASRMRSLKDQKENNSNKGKTANEIAGLSRSEASSDKSRGKKEVVSQQPSVTKPQGKSMTKVAPKPLRKN